MIIVEIESLANGAHCSQTWGGPSVPPGYAVLPADLGAPETLEHFPFGDVTVEEIDGVPTVTGWTPLPMPEPEPGPEPPASLEDRVDALETETAAISAAIERGLSL